jgi:hypothetical protein
LLPVSHLFLDQLNKLQQPIVPVVLPKMGFCSNTSRILTFLFCSLYDGLDFRGLQLKQVIGQLTFIIRHLRTPHAKSMTYYKSPSDGHSTTLLVPDIPSSSILTGPSFIWEDIG